MLYKIRRKENNISVFHQIEQLWLKNLRSNNKSWELSWPLGGRAAAEFPKTKAIRNTESYSDRKRPGEATILEQKWCAFWVKTFFNFILYIRILGRYNLKRRTRRELIWDILKRFILHMIRKYWGHRYRQSFLFWLVAGDFLKFRQKIWPKKLKNDSPRSKTPFRIFRYSYHTNWSWKPFLIFRDNEIWSHFVKIPENLRFWVKIKENDSWYGWSLRFFIIFKKTFENISNALPVSWSSF